MVHTTLLYFFIYNRGRCAHWVCTFAHLPNMINDIPIPNLFYVIFLNVQEIPKQCSMCGPVSTPGQAEMRRQRKTKFPSICQRPLTTVGHMCCAGRGNICIYNFRIFRGAQGMAHVGILAYLEKWHKINLDSVCHLPCLVSVQMCKLAILLLS